MAAWEPEPESTLSSLTRALQEETEASRRCQRIPARTPGKWPPGLGRGGGEMKGQSFKSVQLFMSPSCGKS